MLPRFFHLSILVAALAALAPAKAEEAHLGSFFVQLDGLGLDTAWLRTLRGRISVRYFDQGARDVAEAQWGYIRRILWIPRTFAVAGSTRVRHDLTAGQVDTLIHELTHAANSVAADGLARPGTPEREHADGLGSIAADLTLDPRHENLIGVPRYPRFKADEVMGYFMGASIGELLETAHELASYARFKPGAGRAELGEAAWAAGDLVLPSADPLRVALATRRFGKKRMDNEAYFEGVTIPWNDRGRFAVKDRIYAHALGLKPPADCKELVERLNRSHGAWIEAQRERIAAARRAFAGAAAGPADPPAAGPPAPGPEDALLGQTE